MTERESAIVVASSLTTGYQVELSEAGIGSEVYKRVAPVPRSIIMASAETTRPAQDQATQAITNIENIN